MTANASAAAASTSPSLCNRVLPALRSHCNSPQADADAQNSPGASDMTTMDDNMSCPHEAAINPAATARFSCCFAVCGAAANAIQYASGAIAAPASTLASCAPRGAACVP